MLQNLIATVLIAIGAGWIGFNNGYASGVKDSPQYARLEAEREIAIQAEIQQILGESPDEAFCERIVDLARQEVERRYLLDQTPD